ncbi:MAG: hypothetical protein COB49_11850 [Alphaproteobacteria bacterium]|nr:MAG: hypothetical protein COB49_11850 [Alphaproteobacteria bacterium]
MHYYDFEGRTRLTGLIKLNKNTLKTYYYIFILMLCFSIPNSISSARESDPQIGSPRIYTIYNLSIDETGPNSNRASQTAVKSAQRTALEKLFRKIIREEDQVNLPVLDDGQITELVSGLEVANEKSSPVRYMADFTVHFSRDKIYNFLSGRQIPFAETLSNPASIITVVEKDGAVLLWEKGNDWHRSWVTYDTANNLVPVRVIVSSLANRLSITAWQAQQGDKKALQNFVKEHGLDKLYVMSARIEDDISEGKKILELTIFKAGEDKYQFRTIIDDKNNGEDTENLYNEAIRQATYWLDNQWKEKVMIHFGTSSRLKVKIKYDRGEDWFEIKKKLESISLIRKITTHSLTTSAANVEIEHSGDVEQIILTLEQEDLILTELSDNMVPHLNYPWVLTLKK